MSDFSTLLSQHIHNKNIKVYALSQYCGLDRANMYKIINGKRKPTSLEMVTKMCHFMHLSPSEEKELKEAYQICLVGYDNYYRRKSVMDFFRNFYIPISSFPSSICLANPFRADEFCPLRSVEEVRQGLLDMILREYQSDNGCIRMLIQPTCSFLMDLLLSLPCHSKSISIEHIICFNNASDFIHTERNYNLDCLRAILPLYGGGFSYRCFYYYNHIMAKTDAFDMFPYIIITSYCACLLSSDMKNGLVTHQKDFLKLLEKMFEDYKKQSSSLLRQMDDVFEQLSYIEEMLLENEPGYSFQMTPCLTPFLNSALLDSYIVAYMPHRQLFIETLEKYIVSSRQAASAQPMTFIFSYPGVKNFLETGRIGEYPEDIYTPFEKGDRIYLIKKLAHACRMPNYRMLKSSFGNSTDELYMYIGKTKGYLMFSLPSNRSFIYLTIEEASLLTTFTDFFENMDKEMFYTNEETPELLETLIRTTMETDGIVSRKSPTDILVETEREDVI